jgi:hypothetical protein
MALGALRVNWLRFPDRRAVKTTPAKLRVPFAALEAREVVRAVGSRRAKRRALAAM